MTISHVFNLFLLFFIAIITLLLGGIYWQNRRINKSGQKGLPPDLNLANLESEREIADCLLSEGIDVVIGCDLTDIVTYINYHGKRFLEYSPPEVLGKSLLELAPENYRAKLKTEINYRHSDEKRLLQTALLAKNGQIYEVMLKILPLHKNGKINGSLYLFTDITPLKQIEKENQLQQRELQSLIKLCTLISSTLDLKEVLDFIVRSITEFAKADACTLRLLSEDGQTLVLHASFGVDANLHPEKVPLDKSITGRAVQEKRVIIVPDLSQEETYKANPIRSEEKMASLLCVPLVVKNSAKGVFCLYTKKFCQFSQHQIDLVKAFGDQAAIALVNAKLYSQEQQLVVKLKELNQAKSDFLSMVSHELRSPLTSIKGYTALMLAGRAGEINENQKRFLKIVEGQSDHLTILITDLLNLSRIEAGQVRIIKSSLSLKVLATALAEKIKAQFAEKKINFLINIQENLPFVYGDKEKLSQVINNLLVNAIKFTPENGQVILEIIANNQNMIETRVIDTGIGIPEGELEKIFEKFYQVDSSSTRQMGGAGLGLAIVKRIIEMHDGKVWAESAGDNKGSRFCFSLPIFRSAAVLEEELVSLKTFGTPAPGQKVILLVDDEHDILNLYKIYLEDEGYFVTCAFSGSEVFPRLQEIKPEVIILDLKLPDTDGIQLLRMLKEDPQTKFIPVMVVSILHDKEIQARQLGVSEYLTKPVDKGQLLSSLSEILGRNGGKKSRTILVADDEPNIVELIKIALQRHGYEIKVAYDGEEALAKAKEFKPDLILLDLMMPKVDGYEVLRQLRGDPDLLLQRIPVIIISAKKMEEDRKKGLEWGAQQYLTKPFRGEELIAEVEKIIGDY